MNRCRLIPDYWSAEEALAVYEFIDALRDEIWSRYDLRLIELLREERGTAGEDRAEPHGADDFDDEVPF